MKISFGKTEIVLTSSEMHSLTAMAADAKDVNNVEHLLEMHLGALIDQAMGKYPDTELQEAINEAQALAQAKVSATLEKLRSKRPNSAKVVEISK